MTRFLPDGPLWPGTEMRTFLVLRPLRDFLPALLLSDGLHVEFLQAVPLFDAERAFTEEHGGEALLQLWGSGAGSRSGTRTRAPTLS